MTAPPPRPLENALAVLAALLVAGTLLPWKFRLACAVGTIAIVLLLAALRARAHAARAQKRRIVDVYTRLDRVRADRKARFERPARAARRR